MSIKAKRVFEKINNLPTTNQLLWDRVPIQSKKELSSRQLLSIVKAINKCWEDAKRFAIKEAINEGCLWDNEKQCLIELD